jgi:cytochrome c oxidase subunit 2
MAVALVMVLVVAASVLFHLVSPWRATTIASNWGFIDGTLGLTFAVTALGFVAVVLFMAYCLYRFHHAEGRRAEYEPENQKLEAWLGGLTTLGVIALLAPGLIVWDQFIPRKRLTSKPLESSGTGASDCRAPTGSSARATCATSTATILSA